LGDIKKHDGLTVWLGLQLYPVLLLSYTGGIASLANNQYEFLKTLMTKVKLFSQKTGTEMEACFSAIPIRVFTDDLGKHLPGMSQRRTPVSDHMFKVLRDSLREIIPSDSQYEKLFMKYEYYCCYSIPFYE